MSSKGIFPTDITTKILRISNIYNACYKFPPSHPRWYSLNNTKYEVPRYAIFSNFMFSLYFSFSGVKEAKQTNDMLFIGTKLDIRTFTQLIFLTPFTTHQITLIGQQSADLEGAYQS
jgi:hypothetical protein